MAVRPIIWNVKCDDLLAPQDGKTLNDDMNRVHLNNLKNLRLRTAQDKQATRDTLLSLEIIAVIPINWNVKCDDLLAPQDDEPLNDDINEALQ
jgi:hypothetical protein